VIEWISLVMSVLALLSALYALGKVVEAMESLQSRVERELKEWAATFEALRRDMEMKLLQEERKSHERLWEEINAIYRKLHDLQKAGDSGGKEVQWEGESP